MEPRRMNLMYTHTEVQGMPDAYERLVLEVLRGDATNFVSVDELDASWAVFSPACWRLKVRNQKGTLMVPWGRRSSGSRVSEGRSGLYCWRFGPA